MPPGGKPERAKRAVSEVIAHWVVQHGLDETTVATHSEPTDPGLADQVDAGLDAFWTIADRWQLTNAEQMGMLAVSEATLRRWRDGQRPAPAPDLLDRLSFLVAVYVRVEDWTGDTLRAASFARMPGSAPSPDDPERTLIAAMSTGRLLDLQRTHLFVEALSAGAA